MKTKAKKQLALKWARLIHAKTTQNGGTKYTVYQYRAAILEIINTTGPEQAQKSYAAAHPDLKIEL